MYDDEGVLLDLVDLYEAEQPEDLWRVLVMGAHRRSSTHHWEAAALFRKHHQDRRDGAVDTALLLCTDARWRRCTGKLLAAIVGSGLLDDGQLDELAEQLLWPDRYVHHAPVAWTGFRSVTIPLDQAIAIGALVPDDGEVDDAAAQGAPEDLDARPWDDADGEEEVAEVVFTLDPASTVPFQRWIEPPLRRWAAARIVGRAPARLGEVRGRVGPLGATDKMGAAAVVAGMLDALDALDGRAASQVLDLGLGWPRGQVRLQALEALARREGVDAAFRRAAADPDAKVRRWAAKLPAAPATPADASGPARSSPRP